MGCRGNRSIEKLLLEVDERDNLGCGAESVVAGSKRVKKTGGEKGAVRMEHVLVTEKKKNSISSAFVRRIKTTGPGARKA